MNTDRLATVLGWFSIVLGVTEVGAAKSLGRFFGMEDRTGLLRFFGLREIATGIGILSQNKRAPWLWARVGGDILDLIALGSASKTDQAKRSRIAFATTAVAGVTMLDAICGQQLSSRCRVSVR